MKKFLIVFCATLLLLPATVRADKMDFEMPSLEQMESEISQLLEIEPLRKLAEAIKEHDLVAAKIFVHNDADDPDKEAHFTQMLRYALIYKSEPEMVQLLIDNGAKVSEIYDALFLTTKYCPLSVMQILVDHGATENINIQDSIGKTALMVAAWTPGNQEKIEFLLENGAEEGINLKDDNGQTALIYAVKSGDPENIRLLLEHNADVYLYDEEGKTAWDYAKETQNDDIIDMLKEAINK